jgi:hypothetical protein
VQVRCKPGEEKKAEETSEMIHHTLGGLVHGHQARHNEMMNSSKRMVTVAVLVVCMDFVC